MKVNTEFGTIQAEPATLNMIATLFKAESEKLQDADIPVFTYYKSAAKDIFSVLQASGYLK